MDFLNLTEESYKTGGFQRETLKDTLLLGKFCHRGITINKSKNRCAVSDEDAERLAQAHPALRNAADACLAQLQEEIFHGKIVETGTNDDIFRAVHQIRLSHFDRALFWDSTKRTVHEIDGIDDGALCEEALKKKTYLLYLSEDTYVGDFLAFLKSAAGKKLYFLVSDGTDGLIPDRETIGALINGIAEGEYIRLTRCGGCADLSSLEYNRQAQSALEAGEACFVGFGNDALMQAHDLRCDAVIFTVPRGMPAKAVCGLYTRALYNRIFVPKGFSIFRYVPFVRPTELTYYHLSVLAKRFGRPVYEKDLEALRMLCPELFLNIYDDHLPPQIRNGFTYAGGGFEKQRELYFTKSLAGFRNIKYLHACFDAEDFTPCEADWTAAEKQNKIVADGILADVGTKLSVFVNDGLISPRTMFYDSPDTGKYFISNFSFFMTGRLMAHYNALRAARPREQIRYATGYLDYYRYYDREGKKHETFPLYRKAAIAVLQDGTFAAFCPGLAGGSVTLSSGKKIVYESSDVDPQTPHDVAVYTPMLSMKDCEEDAADYTLTVGAGRMNLVIVGERIAAVRKGDVLLPAMGVVLSLSLPFAERFSEEFRSFDEDGYCTDFDGTVEISIGTPTGICESVWENARCIYGGGLSLMEGGRELLRREDLSEFRREGWLTPLSRQTQESPLHAIARHPRTEVGVTKDGRLLVLVISGRSNTSVGADYFEACRAAKKLVPELDTLINYDGGGSSLLGLLDGSTFMEISVPAPSDSSLTGMARTLNSILRIEAE